MESQTEFDSLFKRVYPKLFFYARGIVGNDDDAEEPCLRVPSICCVWLTGARSNCLC